MKQHRTPHLPAASTLLMSAAFLIPGLLPATGEEPPPTVIPLTPELAATYRLDPSFYKKATMAGGILIATSGEVADVVHQEAAWVFGKVMSCLKPEIAQRILGQKVLCILVGYKEMVSDLPQFGTDKTGKELDFYNWRNRGFLTKKDGRPVFLFSEEDVMEYDGGMQLESILIHEFGHVIDGAGFDKQLHEQLSLAFAKARESGLYHDGLAAQRFRRVTSETPVNLLDALVESFPDQPREFLTRCLDGGDILVNGEPSTSRAEVTAEDKVLIVFGGPKNTYSLASRAEYWAEGVQAWFDTNRTMDHDHNHIHTRAQLKEYDPALARLCETVFGDTEWRFSSPRDRAGQGHLAGYDPATAPRMAKLPHIEEAAQDYYDDYWKDYWSRLHEKYPETLKARSTP
jgi:hypothetical protein